MSDQSRPRRGRPAAVEPDEVDAILADWAVQRPSLESSPIGVFGRISRINTVQRSILRDVDDRYGLTLASFDVLANLRRSGPPHRKTAGQLAESSLLTTGGITLRLDKAEADGLVRRVRSEEDRRVVHAELTDRGRELIDKVVDAHVSTEREMLAELSDDDVEVLCDLLRSLGRSLQAHTRRAGPSPE